MHLLCKSAFNWQKMSRLLDSITEDSLHKDKNCILLTIITHGVLQNDDLHLLASGKHGGWYLEHVINRLCEVPSLVGKPKILIVQACRSKPGGFHCKFLWVWKHNLFLWIWHSYVNPHQKGLLSQWCCFSTTKHVSILLLKSQVSQKILVFCLENNALTKMSSNHVDNFIDHWRHFCEVPKSFIKAISPNNRMYFFNVWFLVSMVSHFVRSPPQCSWWRWQWGGGGWRDSAPHVLVQSRCVCGLCHCAWWQVSYATDKSVIPVHVCGASLNAVWMFVQSFCVNIFLCVPMKHDTLPKYHIWCLTTSNFTL